MCRSPLCSLVEMFPYIHSLSSSDAAAENKASKTLLGSGNLISISLKKQAGQMVLSSLTVACARALDLATVACHKRLCQLVYWVYCTEGRQAGWGGCSEKGTQPFFVSSFCQLLGSFQNLLLPKGDSSLVLSGFKHC